MTITVDRSEEFEAMRRRLRLINRGEKTMEMEDAEYWGDRFTSQRVRFWAGCTFKVYLRDPLYWDTIAAAIRARYSDHRRPPTSTDCSSSAPGVGSSGSRLAVTDHG